MEAYPDSVCLRKNRNVRLVFPFSPQFTLCANEEDLSATACQVYLVMEFVSPAPLSRHCCLRKALNLMETHQQLSYAQRFFEELPVCIPQARHF